MMKVPKKSLSFFLLKQALPALIVVLGFLVASGQASEKTQATEQVVQVNLDEWHMVLNKQVFKAGRLRFKASNQGKVSHELVVIRTDLPAEAFQVAGGIVQEDAVGEVMGEIEGVFPHSEEMLSLDLSKGSYVLFCNNLKKGASEGHYQKGMRVSFTVR